MESFFDLRSAAEGVVASLYPKAEALGIDLTCVVRRDVAGAQGDVLRLETALRAMVDAALEVVGRGELVLTVHRDGEKRSRGSATIGFRVHGGEASRTSYRDEFLADSDRRRAVLRHVQRAVAAAGGELQVQSLAIGAVDLRFTAAYAAASHLEHHIGRLARLANLRVLVVDDAEPRRRSLRELLAACGCSVQTAAGAVQAMEILRAARAAAQPIRLLLVSSELIEVPAAVFCRSVRKDPGLRVTRLILVSQPGRGSSPVDLAADGFGGELIRPVTRASLLTLVAPEHQPRRSVPVADLTRLGSEGGRRRRARVLLAEDDEANRRVSLAILESLGYRAESVENGHEALRALSAAYYDIVLMDITMPSMDGLETTLRIRRGEAGEAAQQVPILALTCHVESDVRTRCLDAGMNAFIGKPIDADRLRIEVAHWLAATEPRMDAVRSFGGEGEEMLDFAELLRRLDQDIDVAWALLDIFTRNLGETLAGLEEALGLADKEQMRRAAHAIKGMARNVSATHLAELAGRFEQLGREGRLDVASGLLTELHQCRERTEARIHELMRAQNEIAHR